MERTTVSGGVARAAGVSPSLLQHHFVTKDGLRSACDQYVVARLRRTARVAGEAGRLPPPTYWPRPRLSPHRCCSIWLGHSLAALPLRPNSLTTSFAVMEEMMARAGVRPGAGNSTDARRVASIYACMKLGVIVFHQHLTRILGDDTLTPRNLNEMRAAVIEHATRRVRILGATARPTAAWVTQALRNLAMDLQDAGSQARFLVRDRDGKYPAMFDTILADTGIDVVLSGVRMPRMNAIMERWIQTCRRELLDRTLVWNQVHLLHALRQYERHYNEHRPTAASRTRDRYRHCPNRSPPRPKSRTSQSADTTVSAASCTNPSTPHD